MQHNHTSSPEARAEAPASLAAAPAEAPNDPAFATAAEEDAFWSGVSTGARIAGNVAPPPRPPGAAVPPRAQEDSLAEALELRAGARPEGGRARRHDGWTPLRMIRFLETLAACGCVADACRSVGMSVSAAYALKNRREGRAWSVAWEALLVNRARGRLADETVGRAMNGCIEQIVKDGEVVAERRRHDNRLSMAVLSRLDRLAERKDDSESALLRSVSEDIEDFYDCIEAGGDADAFIDARRPAEEDEKPSAAAPDDEEADPFIALARLGGVSDWRHVDVTEVPIADLDPTCTEHWDLDAWIRAERSGYHEWILMMEEAGALPLPEDCPAEFERIRRRFAEAWNEASEGLGDAASPEAVARVLEERRLAAPAPDAGEPAAADVVGGDAGGAGEGPLDDDEAPAAPPPCQPSTSSTSRPGPRIVTFW